MSDLTKWKCHASTDDATVPCLHDCVVTEIRQDGSELLLYLPNGFLLSPNDPRNPYKDAPRKTGAALAAVSLGFPDPVTDPEEAIRAELFHRHRICRGVGFTTVSYPDVSDLIDKVNRGKWTLEFISKYPCYDTGYFVTCCFNKPKRYAYRNCYLTVDCRRIDFYWSEVKEEPAW